MKNTMKKFKKIFQQVSAFFSNHKMLRRLLQLLLKRVMLALIEQIPIPAIIVIVIAILAVAFFYACLLPIITDKRKNK